MGVWGADERKTEIPFLGVPVFFFSAHVNNTITDKSDSI